MGVARRHGVADTKQLESAFCVVRALLRLPGEQGGVVDRALVRGKRLEFQVQLVQRPGAVVHHHLVHAALLAHAAVVAADDGEQAVALAPHRFEPERDGEGHLVFLQAAHVGDQVHGHHFRGKGTVRRHDLHCGATVCNHLGRLQGRVVARVVEQQHVAAGLHVASQDVPARHDQFVAGFQYVGMRQTAGRNNHHVGRFGQHGLRIGQGVEPEHHAALLATRHAPVDDADHFASARTQSRQTDLAPRFGCRFQHGHSVSAFGRDARRFQTCRTCAHDDELALDRGGHDVVRHRQLAPGRRVVDAVGFAALVDAVQAEVGPHAGPDAVFAPGQDLAHDVRVGHVGARHADHVELA